MINKQPFSKTAFDVRFGWTEQLERGVRLLCAVAHTLNKVGARIKNLGNAN